MLFIKAAKGKSPIADIGCFAKEDVKKGTIIGILAHDVKVMQETEYQAAQARGEMIIVQTAIRWAGEFFLFCDSMSTEDYINHSFDPNMLYHCGVLFARRDIKAGEELTANYHYFLAYEDVNRFTDIHTGRMADGLRAQEALTRSAQELLELLGSVALTTPKKSEYKKPAKKKPAANAAKKPTAKSGKKAAAKRAR